MAPGRLRETIGALELELRVGIEGPDLVYASTGARLRLGPLRLRLPRGLAPRVEAREGASVLPGETRLDVRVMLPGVGLLLAYSGGMRPEPETA